MRGGRPGKNRDLRNGLITLGLIAFGIFLAFNGGLPFRGEDGRPVQVELAQANNLFPGDPVRVAGVEVGEVAEVDLAAGARHASVVLRIADDDLDLRADASARARLRSLTGGTRYVELDPGSADAPLGDEPIALASSAAAVEFDDLLGTFRQRARRGIGATLAGLDAGLAKGAAARALKRIAPAWKTGTPALESLLGRRRGDLAGLVEGAGRAMAALARDEDALAGLVDGAAAVFAVTGARRGDLERTLTLAPGALADTRATMARLRPTLTALDRVAARLRPGARELGPAAAALDPMLARLERTLNVARPLTRSLRPVLRKLDPASRAGARLFEGLDPTVETLREELIPFLNARDPDTGLRNYESIGPGLSAAGNATSEFDANGHMLRFQTAASERTFSSLPCQLLLTDPTAAQKIRCDALESVLNDIFGNFALQGVGRR